ncbi:hypothetical protein [Altererythrobacter aquiaggeris]|uniref:hypothetical protein n=1 Tax=Aestuarierythrobacter aquiaggeris TaxID=1898396 RepID=UPI0030166CFE
MNTLNIQIDENTSLAFEPYMAALTVRGVVTFETDIKPEDLTYLVALIYRLMDAEKCVDPVDGEYKSATMELRIPHDNDDETSLPETSLRIGYQAEIEGQLARVEMGVSEEFLVGYWKKNRDKLVLEATKLGAKAKLGDEAAANDLRTLEMIIHALEFVSGEPAQFANAFQSWAHCNGKEALVSFPSALPMAA